ncbi:hypothetical protein ACHAWF_008051 [Thalassiosira exigua]
MLAKIRPAQSSLCLKMQQPTAFLSVPYPPSLANPAARSRFVGSLDASSPSKDRSTFWRSREDCWRPDVRDVEKISWGLPAKKKRTGSRGVPHRLNEDERRAFDQARRQGFLQVTGSSWRSQRRDAPLLNSYRSLMDARSRPMIVLHKMSPQSEVHTGDRLVVDLSPLRLPTEFKVVEEELKKRVFEEFAVEGSYLIVEEDDALTQVSSVASDDDEGWGTRPIYQLPPYSFSWNVDRQKGKGIGKFLAILFDNAEAKAKASSKPRGVKPGKSRRHGGYGIG